MPGPLNSISASVILAAVAFAQGKSAGERHLTFNGQPLAGEQLAKLEALERVYRTKLPKGGYWYDNRSGALGRWGGPAAALIPAGLGLGGPLPPDCSHGTTPVYINGRRLHIQDILYLSQFVQVIPGRYWLNADGDFGFENAGRLGNLFVAAKQAQASLNTNHNGGRAKYAMDGISIGDGYYLERGGSSATRY